MEMKCLAIFLSGYVCHSLTNKLQAQPAHLHEQINGPDREIATGTLKLAFLDDNAKIVKEKIKKNNKKDISYSLLSGKMK